MLPTAGSEAFANPYVALAVLSGVSALALAAITWTRRDADGAGTYAALLVVLSVWALLYAGQLLAPTVAAKAPWLVTRHAAAPAIAVTFWVFTARYTSRPELLSWPYVGPVLAVGGLIVAAVVVNPGGAYVRSLGLFTEGSIPLLRLAYGPVFWVQVAYLAGVVGTAHVYIVDLMRRTFQAYRTQLAVLIATGVIEFALFFLHITEHVGFVPTLNPFPHVDLIVFGAVLFAVPIGWSYRNQAYFHLRPLGRETVMEHIDDAVVVFDANGRCVYHNAAARDLLGPDAFDVDGRPTAAALLGSHPAVHDRYRAAAADADDSGDTRQDAVPVDVNGETRYYDLEASTVRNSRGERAGTALVARDVTRLRRQAERLDAFAGTVSHDLQNPLHTAQGYLELAREGDTEHLDEVAESLDRIEEIIGTLLAVARTKRPVGAGDPTPLAGVVADAWEAVDADGAGLEVTVDAGLRIDADPSLTRTIVENLLRNSVEHGSAGNRAKPSDPVERGSTGFRPGARSDGGDRDEPSVTVTVGRIDGDDGFEGFYVEDDGDGIPPEERDRVFEYGYTTGSDGTGFGLTIVREGVEAHGWSIEATRGTDGGARFEITGVDRVA